MKMSQQIGERKTVIDMAKTADMMLSPDYKERFLAEYAQTKIRYERLKAMLTKWEAFDQSSKATCSLPNWLGFEPSCSYGTIREQQKLMGELLHILEVRAVIEDIDLKKVVVEPF